ncbi:LuxR C-terminal-related transcriptional regulator [Parasphingorhabdus halotolerans]|uniref:PAS domain-containing protein n=1 Tax=Parasphingorhabdus halotolerans TaxID=2725558 RepID=A0A6H2DQ83_9SPHN|nr:LuxR C-terminal-related transcriptional regulator [Parasphingorhabdus halotolerans]QJB70550.1 PAS domain-containing protein [Parasphingorhabdus halotolerans]
MSETETSRSEDPRKISEVGLPKAAVRKLIENSPIASVISNPRLPDNPIIASNEAFSALTGYDADFIIGRNCRFLAGEATEPWLTEEIRRGVRERKSVLVEILNYKKDGTPFQNAVLVAPLFDDDGELEYFLGSQVEMESDGPSLVKARRMRAVSIVKDLSKRQREVLNFIAKGFLNKQIAYELNLSERTIKMHRSILMKRLNVPSAADMVRIAVEAGM